MIRKAQLTAVEEFKRYEKLKALEAECNVLAERHGFTSTLLLNEYSSLNTCYKDIDKSKYNCFPQSKKIGLTSLNRLEEMFSKFINKYNDAYINSDDVVKYLSKKISAHDQCIDLRRLDLCGDYHVFRRAYSEPREINISSLTIKDENGFLTFESTRKNNNGLMEYTSSGVIIINTNNTATLISLATSKDKAVCFFESVNIAIDNLDFNTRFYGIYSGHCSTHHTPFSTRTTFLKISDKNKNDLIVSVALDSFNNSNQMLNNALDTYTTRNLDLNIYNDIIETITCDISDTFGGLRHFRTNKI